MKLVTSRPQCAPRSQRYRSAASTASGAARNIRLERVIRDACGALIMVSNDRYLHENAQMLPVRKTI